MDKLSAVMRAAAATSGERPHFLEHPDCDRLLAMLLAAAGQLTVVYERLDTLTRLLEEKGVLTMGEIDRFEPEAAVQAERLDWDEAFVRRLLRVLTYEFETLQAGAAKQD